MVEQPLNKQVEQRKETSATARRRSPAHVCKAGALFGVAEGELVSNGAGIASGVGAADPDGQATP